MTAKEMVHWSAKMRPTPEMRAEIIKRGQERYDRDIRPNVEVHHGKMLALDVDSGEYELGDDSITAVDRLKGRIPGATVYLLRVGYPTAVRIGAGCKTG